MIRNKREMDYRSGENSYLQLASMEQERADENVLRLVEEQKREREEALSKILELERQLDAKQKLEMEIEELKGKVEVMKHIEDQDDEAVQKKMKEINDELKEKEDDLTNLKREREEALRKILDVENSYLQLVSMEQERADENVLRLVEEQKREREEALSKILELERQLDAKQKLEMEIEELKGKVEVMKHIEDQDDEAVQKKMKEINDELKEKEDDMTNLKREREEALSKILDVENSYLQLVSMEQERADENVLRLVEEQKREREEALSKILELERQLDAKQKLEMEIEELKGKVEVMEHLEDQDDEAVQKKMNEINDELKEKEDELTNLEDLNSALISKERQSKL